MGSKKSLCTLCMSFCFALFANAGWIVETDVVDDVTDAGSYI